MATNPWDAFPAVQQTGPVYGAPDPQAAFREEDQQFQRNAESRSQVDQSLQIQAAQRAAAAEERANRAEARALTNDARGTEAERTAGYLSGRIVDSVNRIAPVARNNPSAQQPEWGAELVRGIAGDTAANLLTSADRQQIRAAQLDILDAALTLGTGAAYTKEQLAGYAQSYFPQIGDSPETVESKRQALRTLLGRAAGKAGVSAPDIQNAIAAIDSIPAIGQEIEDETGLTVNVTDDSAPNVDPGTVPPTSPPGGGGGYLDALARGTGSVVEGIASIPALVVDPLSTTIGRALGYDNYTSDFARTVREDLGLPDNPDQTADAIIRGGTSALTGAGLARVASSIITPGAVQNALATFGGTPLRDTAAGAGAALGGEVGRQVGGVPGQVVGTLAGGLGGYGAAGGVARQALGERAPNALLAAGQRQGVDVLPAEVGGPVSQAITTGTRASPLSVAPVVRSSRQSQEQLGAAAGRVARSQGDVVTSDVAGESVRSAAQRFTKQTSERGSRLYDRAGEAARGVRIKPNQTLQRIDDYIARTAENPAATEADVNQLQRFRDNIANGVSVQGLRDARTALSQGVYNGQLRSGADQTMWKDILGNLSEDIDVGLRSVGREGAANLFNRADSFWRDRVEHIDEVLQPILGKDRGGEQIFDAIESMARGRSGGGARLSRLLSNMTDQEAGNVRATVIDRLGKASAGAQGAEGDTFSPATFLTNWNKMTPQAKASLFSEKGLRNDLNDIAALAEGKKVSQSMANYSNTGVAVGSNVGAGVALAASHPVVVALGAGAQYVTGRLMGSPRFARLLATSAKLPPEQASRRIVDQLSTIAAREPALANDARGLQQYLSQAMSQSPSRAVAGENEQQRRREPVR